MSGGVVVGLGVAGDVAAAVEAAARQTKPEALRRLAAAALAAPGPRPGARLRLGAHLKVWTLHHSAMPLHSTLTAVSVNRGFLSSFGVDLQNETKTDSRLTVANLTVGHSDQGESRRGLSFKSPFATSFFIDYNIFEIIQININLFKAADS